MMSTPFHDNPEQTKMLDEAIIEYYGEPVENSIKIVSSRLKKRGGGVSSQHHWVDIPGHALGFRCRVVQHHYESVQVCTLFYEYDDDLNDALKATGLGWFDKRVGGWNIQREMAADHADHIAALVANRFEEVVDMNADLMRSRKDEFPEEPMIDNILPMPFHARVRFEHVRAAIRELKPDIDPGEIIYIANGEGYGEWPIDYGDVMDDIRTRYPFLLLCYDMPQHRRQYVVYNVLGKIAERIEDGGGNVTRTLFRRIARTFRESREPVMLSAVFHKGQPEVPSARNIYRGDITPWTFSNWTDLCSHLVPHVLRADYTLPCGDEGHDLPKRRPIRLGRDVAPSTDTYLRRVADFFGGDMSQYRTDSCYAGWPDVGLYGHEQVGEMERPEDDRIPIVIGSHVTTQSERHILRVVAKGMAECIREGNYVNASDAFEAVIMELLGIDPEPTEEEEFDVLLLSALDGHAEDIILRRERRSINPSALTMEVPPYHIETLLMIAEEAQEKIQAERKDEESRDTTGGRHEDLKGRHIADSAGEAAKELSVRLGVEVEQSIEEWREDYVQAVATLLETSKSDRNPVDDAQAVVGWSETIDMEMVDAISSPVAEGQSVPAGSAIYAALPLVADLLSFGEEDLIPYMVPNADIIFFHDMDTGEDIVAEMRRMYSEGDMLSVRSADMYLNNLRLGRVLPSPNAGNFYRNLLQVYRDGAIGLDISEKDGIRTAVLRIKNIPGMSVASALHHVPVGKWDDVLGPWYEAETFCLLMPRQDVAERLITGEMEAYVVTIYDDVRTIGSCLLMLEGDEVIGNHAVGTWPYDSEATRIMVRRASERGDPRRDGGSTMH